MVLFRSFLLFVFLCISWYIMSGFDKPFFLISGVICSFLCVVIVHRMDVIDDEGQPLHLSLGAPLYWLWLFKEMFLSSARVAHVTLAENLRIDPDFETIVSNQHDPGSHAAYANSITLTPGTVSVNIEQEDDETAHIYVHALEKSSLKDLKDGRMQQWVKRLTGMS